MRYSAERKEAVLKKMLPPNNRSIREIAEEEGKGPGRDRRLVGAVKKGRGDLGGRRGRMISTLERRQTIALIEQAVAQGAPQYKACELLGISARTYQRWTRNGGVKADGRPDAERPARANRLTEAERARILAVCNQPEYSHLPPSQIVPILADQGEYIASESSFYRVLREAGQVHHRGRAQPPTRRTRPKTYRADGPNQVWSWDITFLKSPIAGQFYRLYLAMDIYSRKIVGWEVHERESADLAARMIRKACLAEGITSRGLVLHSDNGAPMKGATMLATEGRDHAGDVATTGRGALVQPAFGEQRQSLLREPVRQPEIQPGIPSQAIRQHRGGPDMGAHLRHLVQRDAPSQRHPVRHPQPTSPG